jgi:hypothetical protein
LNPAQADFIPVSALRRLNTDTTATGGAPGSDDSSTTAFGLFSDSNSAISFGPAAFGSATADQTSNIPSPTAQSFSGSGNSGGSVAAFSAGNSATAASESFFDVFFMVDATESVTLSYALGATSAATTSSVLFEQVGGPVFLSQSVSPGSIISSLMANLAVGLTYHLQFDTDTSLAATSTGLPVVASSSGNWVFTLALPAPPAAVPTVPEPATMTLASIGAVLVLGFARRRRCS